jgi:hypothetical protein
MVRVKRRQIMSMTGIILTRMPRTIRAVVPIVTHQVLLLDPWLQSMAIYLQN